MTTSPWTTKSGTRSGPTVSYAERLRQANAVAEFTANGRDQSNSKKISANESSPTSASSEALTSSSAIMHSPKSVPLKIAEPPSTSPVSSSHSAQGELESEFSNGNDNVWELRMRRRHHRDLYPRHNSDSSSTQHTNHKLKKSPHSQSPDASFMQNDHALSLDDIANDAWLHRIHMLNGGKSAPLFVKRLNSTPDKPSSPSSSGDVSESHESDDVTSHAMSSSAPDTTMTSGWSQSWLYQPGPQPVYLMTPYGLLPSNATTPATYADGSFSPHRSMDSYQHHMRHDAPFPMGYPRMVPMQDKLEGSVWSRRGRAGRGRGSSRASVITHGMQNGAVAMQPAQRPEGPASLPDGYPHLLVKTKQDEFNDKSHSDTHQHHIDTESNTASSTSSSGHATSAQNGKVFPSNYGPYMAPFMNQPGAPVAPYSMPLLTYVAMDPNASSPMPTPVFPYYVPAATPATNASVLSEHLRTQVEFYFSDANLASDFFLRQKMDDQGFVALETILEFKRLRSMFKNAISNASTDEPQSMSEECQKEMLRSALAQSQVLELSHDHTKIRRQNGWQSYLLTPN